MVNRERFMLDFDSEGFVEPPTNPYATLNIGKTPDVRLAQALLQDRGCLQCPPSEQCPRSGYCELRNLTAEEQAFVAAHEELHKQYANPKGWDEVDGVKLPLITWADEHGCSTAEEKLAFAGIVDTSNIISDAQFAALQNELREIHEAEITNARAIVADADRHMDGVTRLSDTSAPDAYFGWKS